MSNDTLVVLPRDLTNSPVPVGGTPPLKTRLQISDLLHLTSSSTPDTRKFVSLVTHTSETPSLLDLCKPFGFQVTPSSWSEKIVP